MTMRVFNNINWDNIMDGLIPTDHDLAMLAREIVTGMIDRIRYQMTSKGEPLSENSARWIAKKENMNLGDLPLQFTGGLTNETTYEVIKEGDRVFIQLEPSYRNIHIDLIEISEATGKNYQDWFGIHVDDIEAVMVRAEALIVEKLGQI